jgi:hypothetical protein
MQSTNPRSAKANPSKPPDLNGPRPPSGRGTWLAQQCNADGVVRAAFHESEPSMSPKKYGKYGKDVTFQPERELCPADLPSGVDRRAFMMRSAVVGAAALIAGRSAPVLDAPANRRVDFDTTVAAMALTAKEMNAKYKETSEGGLAVSVTLC